MAKIRGILFDLGDTLLDFGPFSTTSMFRRGAELCYEWLTEIGQKLPSFRRFFRRQLWSVRLHFFWSRLTGREFNSLDLIRKFSLGMRLTLSPDQLEHLAWLWYEPLALQATTEAGLGQLLEKLQQQGYQLGLISNTFVPGEVLDKHLAMEKLLQFFPIRIYSCDVLFRKPNPAIFRLALERMNLPAAEVLFVGDTLSADVAGANGAGLISVLKDPGGKRVSKKIRPAYTIQSLLDLPSVLDRCNFR